MFDFVNCWLGYLVGNVDQFMLYSFGLKVKLFNIFLNVLFFVVMLFVCEGVIGVGIGGFVMVRFGKVIDGVDVVGIDGWNVYEVVGFGVSCVWLVILVLMVDLVIGVGLLEI